MDYTNAQYKKNWHNNLLVSPINLDDKFRVPKFNQYNIYAGIMHNAPHNEHFHHPIYNTTLKMIIVCLSI